MRLTEEQKVMIGIPVVSSVALCALIIPIVLACAHASPLWLLLWIAGAPVVGALCAALRWTGGSATATGESWKWLPAEDRKFLKECAALFRTNDPNRAARLEQIANSESA